MEIPLVLLIPAFSVPIMYWMGGMQASADAFFLFFFVVVITGMAGNSIGMFLGTIIDDPQAISTAINTIVVPLEMFAGLFVNLGSLPSWLAWMQWISPLRYGFNAGMENEVEGRPSLIENLNFGLSFWSSMGLLLLLMVVNKILALISLKILIRKA